MAKKVRCWCQGDGRCQLCHGKRKYDYEPGPRGWQPFPCPTCESRGSLSDGQACLTCDRSGKVDPANPPPAGMLDIVCKIFFGA
jgi:hypothetical protein